MQNSLELPQEQYKLAPEALLIAETYLACLDIDETAQQLGVSTPEISQFLNKKEVKRFIDTIFLEKGYANKFKLQRLLDTIIESKLEEAEESGVFTNKDLLDVLKLQSDITKDIRKTTEDTQPQQTNIQVNNNLSGLLEKLVNA